MATNDFLTNQAIQAQNNPNIINDLVSAPASPVPPQATGAAQNLSTNLSGSGFVSGAENTQEGLLKQLFQYDQMLEGKYANPFPQVQGFVQNPADMYQAGAGYAQAAGGLANKVGGIASDTERSYQNAIAGLLDKYIQFAQLQEEKKAKKEQQDYQQKKDAYELELSIAKITGGDVTNPFTGKTVHIPNPNAAEQGRSIAELLGTPGLSKNSVSQMTPPYSPARAGITETVNGTTFVSDAKGGWQPIGGQPTDQGTGFDRNQIIAALAQTTNPKEYARLSDLLQLTSTGAADPREVRIISNQLRDEYAKESQNYTNIRDAYNKVKSAGTKGGVGDISVITSFAKAIDPTSSVREGEFKTVAEAGSWLSQTYNVPVKIIAGNKLAPETRKLFQDEMKRVFNSYETQHQQTVSEYTRLAQQYGIDPRLVIIDYSSNADTNNTIRVKLKSTGQTGTIPADEFDSNLYERL